MTFDNFNAMMNIAVPLVTWSFLGFLIFNMVVDLPRLFIKAPSHDGNHPEQLPTSIIYLGRTLVIGLAGPLLWGQLILNALAPYLIVAWVVIDMKIQRWTHRKETTINLNLKIT